MHELMTQSQAGAGQSSEPVVEMGLDGVRITLLGTAHVSRASADKVREIMAAQRFDGVAVELCASRHNALMNPDALAGMDLFQVLREGKGSMVTASLALGAYQQRLAEQLGIDPGAEMRAAVEAARDNTLPVLLIDREIGITLKRIYRNIPWWRRFGLLAGLMVSVVSDEKVSEAEIERLKQGDMLETTFAQFADQAKELYIPLIDERDRYMAARLREAVATGNYRHIFAVVGAGHLKGIQAALSMPASTSAGTLAALDQVPQGSRWLRYIPWLVVVLVVAGFVAGFVKNPSLGLQMVSDWVLINGALASLGALLAAAHPVTIIGAFIAAPLTSLNPTIGAGMVTAGIEVFMRKPTVEDFRRLRSDTTRLSGWRHNRVAKTLLIFVLSTLGSVVGTYAAGFRILERLAG